MGMGWGQGRARGWRRGVGAGWSGGRGGGFFPNPYYYPSETAPPSTMVPVYPTAIDPKEESKYLEQAIAGLKNEIELIEKRLEELASEKQD